MPVGDLAVTKVPDAAEVAAGATAGFSIVVTNAGPSDAVATEVGDLLPAGITFDPEQSDPTCAVVDTPLGAVRVLRHRDPRAPARPAPCGWPGGSTPANPPASWSTAAAASSPITGEFDFTNNLSEVPITVVQSADLAVSKVADAGSVTPGGQVTYTVGGDQRRARRTRRPSRSPTRSPRALTFVSAPAGCTVVDATVTCTAPTLDAGATALYPIVLGFPAGRGAGRRRQHGHGDVGHARPRPRQQPADGDGRGGHPLRRGHHQDPRHRPARRRASR